MSWTRSAAEAVGSAAALVAFAGAAHASATIDLIWARSGTNESSGAASSSLNTLQIIVTAGSNGVAAAGVSVDFTGLPPQLAVLGYANTPSDPLPFQTGLPTRVGSRIEGFNGSKPVGGFGGLAAGQTHQLGTVTFHGILVGDVAAEIRSDANGPLDDVFDIAFNEITDTTTFNKAYFNGRTLRDCDFVIEVNQMRGGSPTVAAETEKKITAKARIAKGTASPDTTLDATLRIDTIDGSEALETQTLWPIPLEVGGGGSGGVLVMGISQCNSGAIDFVATFSGFDADGDLCAGSRRITKTCE